MEKFTNLYQVIKTLRFELEPITETKKWLQEFSKVFHSNKYCASDDNFFATDVKIVEAKKVLMEVLNKIHENIIYSALTSATVRKIDISQYYDSYISNNDERKGAYVKELRKTLKSSFFDVIKNFNKDVLVTTGSKEVDENEDGGREKNNIPKKEQDWDSLLKDLKSERLLSFINIKADKYTSRRIKKEKIQNACKDFTRRYWVLLSQFLTNRENYYEFDKEKDTAVATRIVSDLLPTFCLNASQYQRRQEEYDALFGRLQSLGIVMQIKNPAKGMMETIQSFDTSIYDINSFSMYINQKGIEKYNAARARNNELINLYNQNCGKKKECKLKPFAKLHKQIGCRASTTVERVVINRDWDKSKQEHNEGTSLEAVLKMIIKRANEMLISNEVNYSEPRLANLVHYLKERENCEGIYVSDQALRIISSRYLEDWYSLQNLLLREKSVGSYDPTKEINEQFKLNAAVELAPVFQALDKMDYAQIFKEYVYEEYAEILNPCFSPSKNLVNLICFDVCNMIEKDISQSIKKVYKIMEGQHEDGIFKKEDNIDAVRDLMDSLLYVIHFIKFFYVRLDKIKGEPYDTEFLQIVNSLLDRDVADWFGWYDAVRNYVQRLPQDEVKSNKLKLNFNSSSLLQGWSVGEEQVKLSMILKNEGIYYLCIIMNDKNAKDLVNADFEDNPFYNKDGQAQRMIMRNLSFKTLTGKGYKKKFGHKYSEETNDEQAIANAKQLIKENFIRKYPHLKAIVEKSHTSKSSFMRDINAVLSNYVQCSYIPVDWELVKQYADKGKLYVFKIHSKDYSPNVTGKKDLQTIYWEDVLNGDSLHQLAAKGEIFRRESLSQSKYQPFEHKEGSTLVNKRDRDGNIIPDKIYRIVYAITNHLPLPQPKDDELDRKAFEASCKKAQWLIDNEKIVQKTAKYTIMKDARFYGADKYFLHNPLYMNSESSTYRKIDAAYYNYNAIIQDWMHEDDVQPYFIGIDRGEKNLIYYCKIDRLGNIESCDNYNIINGYDYLEKLKDRTEARLDAKRDWKQQESIKNLKNGYISQVVHRLVEDTVILNGEEVKPSYIVLEKLSREMKGSRRKIDFQVYQKIELALAKKLGFYVNKEVEEGLPGSIKKPLQLVPPVNTFDQIDKKDSFGIMLYTRPNYTSVTDPATGWRQTIYITNGNSDEILKQIVDTFDDIFFDGTDYVFTYTERNANYQWSLFSSINGKSLDRFEYNKRTKGHDAYDIVKVLNGLFEDFDKSQSLLEQMRNGKELKKVEEKHTAYESLRKAIKMIQQIRNTGNNQRDDNFLLSPVRMENGSHFDTRKRFEFEDPNLQKIADADANGAYNIARKGLIMDAHYRYWKEQGKPIIKRKDKNKTTESSALSLYVSDREWDMWLIYHNMWEEHLHEFAIRHD